MRTRCHGVMSICSQHKDNKGKRTTGGQEKDKKISKKTTGGHSVHRRDQRLWPASFFLRENPNSKLLGELNAPCELKDNTTPRAPNTSSKGTLGLPNTYPTISDLPGGTW